VEVSPTAVLEVGPTEGVGGSPRDPVGSKPTEVVMPTVGGLHTVRRHVDL